MTVSSHNCASGLARWSSRSRIPIGKESNFKGEVNVVNRKAFLGHESGESAVPADLTERLEQERSKLMEVAAESDDKYIEKFLGGEELTDDEMKTGLRLGLRAGTLAPVLCGSATHNIGIPYILKFIADYVPSPAEAPAITAHNPATKQDEKLTAKRERQPRRVRLQDDGRSLRGQADLFSCLRRSDGIRHAGQQFARWT